MSDLRYSLMKSVSMITDTIPISIWQTLFTPILLPFTLWIFHQSHFQWQYDFFIQCLSNKYLQKSQFSYFFTPPYWLRFRFWWLIWWRWPAV